MLLRSASLMRWRSSIDVGRRRHVRWNGVFEKKGRNQFRSHRTTSTTGWQRRRWPPLRQGRSVSSISSSQVKRVMDEVTSDKGRIIMNLGAIASLTGFCMSDVLHLRMLSIFGSCCGVTYNFTRDPRQLNGVAWGLFFISVNSYMIYKLLIERREIKFTETQMLLYESVFKPFDVETGVFYELVQKGKWTCLSPGEKIISRGDKLHSLVMIVDGSADVIRRQSQRKKQTSSSSTTSEEEDDEIVEYSYAASWIDRKEINVDDLCLIGGTALVDPKVVNSTRGYPNTIRADRGRGAEIVAWDLDELNTFLCRHTKARVAILHRLHFSLLQSLRRSNSSDRSLRAAVDALPVMSHGRYEAVLSSILADGVFSEFERGMMEKLRQHHRVPRDAHLAVLRKHGWTEADWRRGRRKKNERGA